MYDLEQIPAGITKLFSDLETRLMSDIVRRIRKTGEITRTADMQLYKRWLMGNSALELRKELERTLALSDKELRRLYNNILLQDYAQYKELYLATNRKQIPYSENYELKHMVDGLIKQTKGEFVNLTRSMGFAVSIGGGKTAFAPFSMYYQQYLDNAVMDIATGSFDYNTVLRKTVKQMSSSGIRTVTYANGHMNRIEVATRRAVMTGVRQLYTHLSEMNAAALGTDHYEVSAHIGARPDHQEWQGGVFSSKELVDICGLGRVDGLCGANCYHMYFPFVKGASVRSYTDEQLQKMKDTENEVKSYQGKDYHVYDARQKQRSMETYMRQQRREVKLLQAGRAEKDVIRLAQEEYKQKLHQYEAYCKAMGLKADKGRIYMDGLGRVA